MSLDDNVLLSIDVSSDDYATAAVEDAPAAVPRGHQTDEDFEATKAAYRARLENGDIHKELESSLPKPDEPGAKPKLDKKQIQLVGQAIGELYYTKRYERMVEVLRWLEEGFTVDAKTEEMLGRWKRRAEERLRG
ncbi:hypothetical protein H2203_008413 [Taxawa tesnikishii (nom. ined.)]|nr:hypothetical protein H2203_008413 [Dothideales sp. JES 119]